MKAKVGDIYRWTWNEKTLKKLDYKNNSGTMYWCSSCICVFKEDGMFWDTYWGGDDYSHDKRFTEAEAKDKLSLEYIGNFDDLVEAGEQERAYYEDKDCVDISHANRSRGGFYIRKGAVKSLDKMRRILNRNLTKLKKDVDYAQRRAADLEREIDSLSLDSHISLIQDVTLTDNCYTDVEVQTSQPE